MVRKATKSNTLSFKAYQDDRAKHVEELYKDSDRLHAIAALLETDGWRHLVEEVLIWAESLIEHLDGIPREEVDTDSLAWQLGQFRGSREACQSILNLPESCLKKLRSLETQRSGV